MTVTDFEPDPTPTATPWQEYLAAARSLDAVRREVAATPAPGATARSAYAEQSQLALRLDQQRARLTGEAVRAGLPAPQLDPTAADLAAARQATAAIVASVNARADTPGTVPAPAAAAPGAVAGQVADAVMRRYRSLLDDCDAQLARPATGRPVLATSLVPTLLAVVAAVLTLAGLALLVVLLFG